MHVNGESCGSCESKLVSSHPKMVDFFRFIRANGYSCWHVAVAGRCRADQDKAVACGESKDPWPTSKHNHCDASGQMQSLALDLFILDSDGIAIFPIQEYFNLYVFLKKALPPELQFIRSGLDWDQIWSGENFADFCAKKKARLNGKHDLVDGDHFEWIGDA